MDRIEEYKVKYGPGPVDTYSDVRTTSLSVQRDQYSQFSRTSSLLEKFVER